MPLRALLKLDRRAGIEQLHSRIVSNLTQVQWINSSYNIRWDWQSQGVDYGQGRFHHGGNVQSVNRIFYRSLFCHVEEMFKEGSAAWKLHVYSKDQQFFSRPESSKNNMFLNLILKAEINCLVLNIYLFSTFRYGCNLITRMMP